MRYDSNNPIILEYKKDIKGSIRLPDRVAVPELPTMLTSICPNAHELDKETLQPLNITINDVEGLICGYVTEYIQDITNIHMSKYQKTSTGSEEDKFILKAIEVLSDMKHFELTRSSNIILTYSSPNSLEEITPRLLIVSYSLNIEVRIVLARELFAQFFIPLPEMLFPYL